MSKQEEIREGMEQIVSDMVYGVGAHYTSGEIVAKLQEFEDSQGVVIKVERELPRNRWPSGYWATHAHFEPTHDAVEEAQDDTLKAGFGAFLPLVEGKHEGKG